MPGCGELQRLARARSAARPSAPRTSTSTRRRSRAGAAVPRAVAAAAPGPVRPGRRARAPPVAGADHRAQRGLQDAARTRSRRAFYLLKLQGVDLDREDARRAAGHAARVPRGGDGAARGAGRGDGSQGPRRGPRRWRADVDGAAAARRSPRRPTRLRGSSAAPTAQRP